MLCPSCGHDNPAEARFCSACGSPLVEGIGGPSPAAAVSVAPSPAAYAGFWVRCAAFLIDMVITQIAATFLSLLLLPLYALALSGSVGAIFMVIAASLLLTLLVPSLYFIIFTGLKGQTVGKMALGITVVNQEGLVPGLRRAALRESVGKSASFIALFLGFLWVAWDPQKRGWHDKIAGTYVIMRKR